MATSLEDNVIEGMQQDDADDDGVFVFGRDISKIPCFRNSFLNGIYAGFGCGIASFLATSRVIPSTHISVASFTIVTLAYWVNCRRQFAHHNFMAKQSESSFPEEIESIKSRKKRKEDTIIQRD